MMERRGHTMASLFSGKPGILIKAVLAAERIWHEDTQTI
jgi:hypothetical protein